MAASKGISEVSFLNSFNIICRFELARNSEFGTELLKQDSTASEPWDKERLLWEWKNLFARLNLTGRNQSQFSAYEFLLAH